VTASANPEPTRVDAFPLSPVGLALLGSFPNTYLAAPFGIYPFITKSASFATAEGPASASYSVAAGFEPRLSRFTARYGTNRYPLNLLRFDIVGGFCPVKNESVGRITVVAVSTEIVAASAFPDGLVCRGTTTRGRCVPTRRRRETPLTSVA
jgi:hypothetical protein